MKVVASSIGKFHLFDLVKKLDEAGVDTTLFTGYPKFKINPAPLNCERIHTFPYLHTPYMGLSRHNLIPKSLVQLYEYFDRSAFDYYVSRRIKPCDIFHGMSSSCLLTGRKAKEIGAKFICDRGSSHIQHQANLLRSEFEKWGVDFDEIDQKEIDSRIIRTELEEYDSSDLIFVPSSFSRQSFERYGVPREKLRLIPYGVDTSLFFPTAAPSEKSLDILFVGAMSLRKGIPYLIQAFKGIDHPNKRLRLIGRPSNTLIRLLKSKDIWDDRIEVLGHRDSSELRAWMSKSHALVLPSIEDGFGLVIAQALACGCPVIASQNTGAPDLIAEGYNGYITSPGDYLSIQRRIEEIASSRPLQSILRAGALASIKKIGGWNDYITAVQSSYSGLLN